MAGTLLIRADAGEAIGTGHLMRCLALAQAWQAAGGRARLASHCPVPGLAERTGGAGVDLELLGCRHPDPADLSGTLAILSKAAAPRNGATADWVAIDGYHFDVAYEQAVRQTGCRVLVIDDMAHRPPYHADLVVNQNLAAEELDYPCDEHTTLLLGPRYALLRPEFVRHEAPSREAPDTARNVLVTLGGEDPRNLTRLVVRALRRIDLPGLEGKIVVGPANPHVAALQTEVDQSSASLQLVTTHPVDMPGLMAWADVAVSAAGSTCWELAFMGVPTVVVVLAENQRRVAEPLAAAGAVLNLGWHEHVTEETAARALASLCRDRGRRAAQCEIGRRLVDGRGADRVVAVMSAPDAPIPEDQLTLRPITADDVFAVWRLANQPTVRANSLSTDPIPLESHVTWFRQKLLSPDTCMWALDFHGVLVGQIRYDRDEAATAVISFSVPAAFRRRGFGSRLLQMTWRPAVEQLGARRLRAVVRQENAASSRIFVKAGYTKVASEVVSGKACHIFEQECG